MGSIYPALPLSTSIVTYLHGQKKETYSEKKLPSCPRETLLELIWEPPILVWEPSNMAKWRSLPMIRAIEPHLPTWPLQIPKDLSVMLQRIKSPSTPLIPSLTPSG